MQGRLVTRLAPLFWLALTTWALPSPAQYTMPGTLAELQGDRKEAVEKAAEEARYRLGPFRVEPWLSLREAGYLFEERLQADGSTKLEGNLTATAGAGLRAYLRTGSRLVWAFHAHEDYVYRDGDDRDTARDLYPVYGAGLFGEIGRLGAEVTASRTDSRVVVSSETLQRTPARSDELRADFGLRLGRALALRFGGSETRFRVLDKDPGTSGPPLSTLQQLDRDERSVALGLEYRLRGGLTVGAGYELTEADFLSSRDRSNDGEAVYLSVAYPGTSFAVDGRVERRQVEGLPGSSFGEFDGTTGRAQLALRPGRRLSPRFYAQREQTYTLTGASPYALTDRQGVALSLSLGRRTGVALFAEVGTESYRAADGTAQGREDELQAWGAKATLELGRGFRFALGWSETTYDSNLPGLDREQRQILGGLTYGVGSGGGIWY